MKRTVTLLLVVLFATPLAAQTPIPSPEEFTGFKAGERFTRHHRIVEYFDELDRLSDLLAVERIGETYEHRPLITAVITSEKNQKALDRLRAANEELQRPDRTSPERAEEIAGTNPVIVWLGFNVHGDEASSSEAAMRLAHRLVSGMAESRSILDECIVILDPNQNPDGRDRYVQWFESTAGAEPNPARLAAEHDQQWARGRFNHYLFDMNRDWAWLTQRETQARIAAFQRWNPAVFVDFHEMGHEQTYFFPPDADPINMNISEGTRKWLNTFGLANAEMFDRLGWPFFVGERYDLFYPAYGDSWPSLRGSVGMTYEMAGGGGAGLAVERENGTILTLAGRIEKHSASGWTTLVTAARNRRSLLLHSYNTLRQQLTARPTTYLLTAGAPNFEPALENLVLQGIEVRQLTGTEKIKAAPIEGGTAASRDFPAGTALISTRQPLGALVRALFERSSEMPARFLTAQREKVEAEEDDDFYDITAWSVPLSQNVRAWVADGSLAESSAPWKPEPPREFRKGRLGYYVEAWDRAVYRAAGRMLRGEIRFHVARSDLDAGERTLRRGSLIVRRDGNGPDLDDKLTRIARETGANFIPVEQAWAGRMTLGSPQLAFVRDPAIAIVRGRGVDPSSFGALWHTLDIDTPIPHTVIPLENLRSRDLSGFKVIILPNEGSGDGYEDVLGKRGIEKLKSWIDQGGTLVAIKHAAAFLRTKETAISQIRLASEQKKKEDDDEPEKEEELELRIPGSAFRSVISERSYLTFGIPSPPAVLIEGTGILRPLPKRSANIVRIETKDPLISGFAWPESIARIGGAAYMTRESLGDGAVITFADEPFYRGFWRGTLPLFLNSVLYSPSFLE